MPSDAREIRPLRTEEAPALVACVRRCYGDYWTARRGASLRNFVL